MFLGVVDLPRPQETWRLEAFRFVGRFGPSGARKPPKPHQFVTDSRGRARTPGRSVFHCYWELLTSHHPTKPGAPRRFDFRAILSRQEPKTLTNRHRFARGCQCTQSNDFPGQKDQKDSIKNSPTQIAEENLFFPLLDKSEGLLY